MRGRKREVVAQCIVDQGGGEVGLLNIYIVVSSYVLGIVYF